MANDNADSLENADTTSENASDTRRTVYQA
jgi:hypothetical protein